MNDAPNPKVARKTARRKTTRKVGTGKAHRTDRKTASKVVAEKARGAYRKTAPPKTSRKVGVAKTHSSGRKNSFQGRRREGRGKYRKTAARFEEFAYDGQMPKSTRVLAEKSVAQTRELYVQSLEAVLESWEKFASRPVRARWRSTARLSTSRGAISTTVSVLRRGWQGRRTLPRLWNCRQPIGAIRSASWRLKPEKCARCR